MADLKRGDTPLKETFIITKISEDTIRVDDSGLLMVDFDTGSGVGSVALQGQNRAGNWVATGDVYTTSGVYPLVGRDRRYRVSVVRSSGSIDVEMTS